MNDIRSRVLDYNGEWIRSEATRADKEELAEIVLCGKPTRTITVSPIGNGREYRITVTDGIRDKGGFAAAEDPRTYKLRRRDGREDIEAVARKVYGRDVPEGFELHVIRHHH